MQQEILCAGKLKLTIDHDGRPPLPHLYNTKTGEELHPQELFTLIFRNAVRKKCALSSNTCKVESIETSGDSVTLLLSHEDFQLRFRIWTGSGDFVHAEAALLSAPNKTTIDRLIYFTSAIHPDDFRWSIPMPEHRVHIPKYIMTLGQPVYLRSFYMGGEFPTCDNKIEGDTAQCTVYCGRPIGELRAQDGNVPFHSCVIGAADEAGYDACHNAFFAYMRTFSRPERFRLQFNSWYDNMLDIDSNNIAQSFRAVEKGLREHGVRPLDSYVVDDGWVDYQKPEFWAFRKDRFPNEFRNEKKLMEELGSGFGVWFGPRGGYTEQNSYAKKLKKIGYFRCRQSFDICTGAPKYIDALIERMLKFMKEYNVNYFKLDGFSAQACHSKKHGHPAGGNGEKGVYYYTFLWEQWLAGFERLRAADPDVYLNLTSYSHCSPWFLKWVDSVWINNSGDMAYEGDGSNLDQCLNYRDGRYYDYYIIRQQQFPASCIYNHEPCYGKKNYNPPLPSKLHKTVYYTDGEFTKYLLMCMMRGTGFIELYYSPSMFDEQKWEINARILQWAEENFHILRHSEYFGGIPKNGDCYGYAAFEDGKGYVIVRNPSAKAQKFIVSLGKYSLRSRHELKTIYPVDGPAFTAGEIAELELEPREIRLFEISAQ